MLRTARRAGQFLVVSTLFILSFTQVGFSQVVPQSGWWWNPNEGGRGFFIELQGNNIFMTSFLYADNSQATWILSGNVMSANTYSGSIDTYCCGQTLAGPYHTTSSTGSPGSISITFSDSQHGTLAWPGGTVAIQRFSFTASPTPVPAQAGAPQTGWWWNPDESGRGFAIEFQGTGVFIGGFMYAANGSPIWYLSNGAMQTPTSYQGHWDQYCCGQTLTSAYKPSSPVGSVGSVAINFTSPSTGVMTLPDGRQINIVRFQFSTTTPVTPVSVLTYHNDKQRTGANLNETILSPGNVNSTKFGKHASYPVDGQIYAQPLVMANLTIAGGTHNVVFVATEHDSVYAFDADGLISTAFWHRSFINPSAGINPAQSSDEEGIAPELGVTGTPVIDAATGTMYLVAMTNESGGNKFRLHALDVRTGAEKFGGPVVVQPSVSGSGAESVNGLITINPGCYQRSGLLLQNSTVYAAFGHCSHGWIVAFDATSLAQTAVFNTTPNGKGGAIWMGGGAPAADAAGNIYVMTGVDADSTANTGLNNAFVKLSPSLQVLDFFIPSNNAFLTTNDGDLGSGAPLVLPDNSSSHPQELVGGGKDGRIFLLDRTHLGGFNTAGDQVIQVDRTGVQEFDNLFDTPTYWNGFVYVHPENDVVHAFQYTGGLLSSSPVTSGSTTYGVHGATGSVSSSGVLGGILWELQVDQTPSGPAILHAYLASNVATELYNSAQAGARDAAGPAVKFAVPTVANGKVYVGTGNQLVIYSMF